VIFIHVLGAPVIRRPEGPITGRAAHRRRLALVAILAAARGRPVGRERIVGLLWPENPADTARHTLSEGLYVLRKDLGEEAFVVVGDEVGLDPRVRSDLDDFERALDEGRWEDAARAYTGPFLDGFYVSDAPEFERWVEGERDRLARGFGRALEELATAAEAAGAPLRAAEWWRRLLAHDAFSSRVALRLVRALERGGERAAALRAAEAHVLLLREELDVGPEPELVTLMEDLRAEPPAPPPRAPRPAAPPASPAPQDPALVDEDHPHPPGDLPAQGAVSAVPDLADGVGESMPAAASTVPDAARAKPRRRFGMRMAAAFGAAAAVAVLAAVAATRNQGPPPEPEYDPRRIAVLYLDDDSPGGELQYLANGLTEMLIHELSQVEALDVVSRNGVKPYRQGTIPFDSMVADLRVGSVVEGSVQRFGDSVRIVVQLIDQNNSHLESRVLMRPLGDLFAVQRAVSEEVSRFLRRRLRQQVQLRQAEAETRSTEALEAVLRGEQAYAEALQLHRHADPADVANAGRKLEEADRMFAVAERADPRWARPTVGRAWVAVRQASWRELGGAQEAAVDSAMARAGRVLAREPRNARALEARGAARWTAALLPGADSDALLEQAERDLGAAVAAEPRLASAWGKLSSVLHTRGQQERSELAAKRALEYDAWLELDGDLQARWFFSLVGVGDYAAADEACEAGHRAFPRDWRFVECRLTLLRLDGARPPDTALAWRTVAELEEIDPAAVAAGRTYAPIFRRMAAAAVSARAGDAARARAERAGAGVDAAADSESRIAVAYDEAWVLLMLGDHAAARERLEVYLAQRSPAVRRALARDPLVRTLLTDVPAGR
jgi:DNA-binding SARP family transcriptional activator/TolB-like protein